MTVPTAGTPAADPSATTEEESRAASGAVAGAVSVEPGVLALVEALHGPTALFAADAPSFTLLVANDALVATAGRPREALVGRPLAEAFPDPIAAPPEGSGLATLRASLEAAVRTGQPQRMARQRYDLQGPDGTWEALFWDALNTPVREPGAGAAAPVRYVLHQTEDVTARVRQEQAAARAELRATRILERVADAHLLLDGEFRVTYVNAASERLLGMAREAMLGRTHWEVFPASVDNDAGHAYRRVVAEGVEQHLTQHYVGEGYDRHVEIDAYPTDEGGVAIFWRDVTERRAAQAEFELAHRQLQEQAAELESQAEELQATTAHLEEQIETAERVRSELAASEAKYRSLFTSLDVGFCVVELAFDEAGRPRDYRFLEANPAFVQQTGLVDAVGHSARELVPDLEAHWFEVYGRVAITGEPTRFQMGSEAMGRWFDVYAFRTGAPEARQVAVLFTDVTAARAAEQERARLTAALEIERARLAYVFQRAPSFLAVLRGPGYVFTLVNDAYYQLVGHREILGRPLWEALPEVRGQGFEALLDGVRTTGEPFVGREMPVLVARTPDTPAEERHIDLTFLPLLESDGRGEQRATGVIAHGTDVTEQVRARRQIERLLREAEAARAAALVAQEQAEAAGREADAASQAKSGFLATMSHELRTPLNAIIGYAQLLEVGLGGPLTTQQRAFLERLAASSQHLLTLVNDVLDLSKIEAGEARVAHEDAMTGMAVRAALDLVQPQAAAKGVALVDARPDDAGEPYVGDPDRVRQIVLNLLSNAVKFTPAGGTVTVACQAVSATPADAGRLHGAGPWAAVRVTDTGIGIAPEEQGRIFEPFHQVEGGHTRTAGGTGLGLAISRRLARLMHGDLTVESALGAGATFTLWLPARTTGGAQAESATERSARAEQTVPPIDVPELADIGAMLRDAVDDVLAAYADRLRAEPTIPHALGMRRAQLEDHAVSFMADLAQSLVIVGDAGGEAADLLRDGSAIQRTIAEHHGARRFAQGWDEAAVRRDHQVFREEVERAVRARLGAGGREDRRAGVEAAMGILLGLIDRAEAISVRAWRHAAQQTREGHP